MSVNKGAPISATRLQTPQERLTQILKLDRAEYIAAKDNQMYQFGVTASYDTITVRATSKATLENIRPHFANLTGGVIGTIKKAGIIEPDGDQIDLLDAWEVTTPLATVISDGKRVVALGSMTPAILQELIGKGQADLNEIDVNVKKVAEAIAANPSEMEKYVSTLRECYKNQIMMERRLEALLSELESRDKAVKKKNWLRSGSLQQALISSSDAIKEIGS